MNRTLVMKFGGASVATPQHFIRIASIIENSRKLYDHLAVVVSAMGGMTDQLLALGQQVHPNPPRREQDMLISAGERISIALLAMALAKSGIEAVSFTGSQSGIITSANHGEAQILEVKPRRLLQCMEAGRVAIVAGFQGVSQSGEITTLGRGGSDTSAVALAIALEAQEVKFYKDVEGVYSSDPKQEPQARFLPYLKYDDVLSLVEKGAKVLHARSVYLAKENEIPLHVLPFHLPDHMGTWIGNPLWLEAKKRGEEMQRERRVSIYEKAIH